MGKKLFEGQTFENQVKIALSMVWSKTAIGSEDFYSQEDWQDLVEWLKLSLPKEADGA